jgi:general secretion pathway protein A
MYESHFGLSASPFQLNPDPAFYFDSRGHKNALAYLKFGAHQGEGFIVVTGEIGAGKTTLVRTLLEGLDSNKVVAAQVVSTQLESGDLLRAILTAFGIAPSGTHKSQLISSLEGFFTALAIKGRRALLIVDEAQNLGRESVEELRMLSNFQLGNQGLLQSFLVGQPELRALLQSKSMEQLRQRVTASCHLGPLDPAETRGYIVHRLMRVGWKRLPFFEEEAYEHIHLHSGGIPRRINRLCNRLLLGAFLADHPDITAESVTRTAQDLGEEIGEIAAQTQSFSTSPPVQAPFADTASGFGPTEAPSAPAWACATRGELRTARPVLCIVDTRLEYLQSGALAHVMHSHAGLPSLITVHTGRAEELAVDPDGMRALPSAAVDLHLQLNSSAPAASTLAETLLRFDEVLQQYQPVAVLVMGASDAALACSILTKKKALPLLRLESRGGQPIASSHQHLNTELIGHASDVLYTNSIVTDYTLHRVGIVAERTYSVGNLVTNVMFFASTEKRQASTVLDRWGLHADLASSEGGYGLVTWQLPTGSQAGAEAKHLEDLVEMLRVFSGEIPLVWAVTEATLSALRARNLETRLRACRVALVPVVSYLDLICVLREARCLITSCAESFLHEALSMHIPVLVATGGIVAAVKLTETPRVRFKSNAAQRVFHDALASTQQGHPEAWEPLDGGAAARICTHMGQWLSNHHNKKEPAKEEAAVEPSSRTVSPPLLQTVVTAADGAA